MRNHGPNTDFHEKPSHVSGRFVRLLTLFATLLAGGMAANQVAAQGLVVFSPTSASFGNVNEGGSKTLSMTIWTTAGQRSPLQKKPFLGARSV
jgi:uncharacterized surface protein with fasciclin (FAS1) repeats